MAYFVIYTPGKPSQRILLSRISLVGRGMECQVFIDDPGLSRRHCRIEPHGIERWAVVDLGSANGTYVDGRRINEHVLVDEQTIYIGNSRIAFYEGQFIAQRPQVPRVSMKSEAMTLDREAAAENDTVVGFRLSKIRPMPMPRDFVRPKPISPEIPLPFRRPTARPIPRETAILS